MQKVANLFSNDYNNLQDVNL